MEEDIPIIERNTVEVLELINGGGYGTVYKINYYNRLLAMKIIIDESESEENRKSFENELKKLYALQHPNIIEIIGVCFNKNNLKELSFIMELMECSLSKLLYKSIGFIYDLTQILNWSKQIAEGLDFMHSKKFVHRDIKPGNILLKDNYQIVKLCDLGIAATIRSSMTDERGTSGYTAPEVILGTHYDEKCDVYSFAITLWAICSKEKPFKGLNNATIILKVIKEIRPSLENIKEYPDGIRNLIIKCWEHDPKNRPPMSEVLNNISEILNSDNFETGKNDNMTNTNILNPLQKKL